MRSPQARWILAAAILLSLGGWGAARSFPLLRDPCVLSLTLPAGTAGDCCPLVATGQSGAGDLLYLRYLDATTLVIGYDSWAVGGPVSASIRITPGAARPLVVQMPSLAAPSRVDRRALGLLRVVYDGREVLRDDVHYYGRARAEIHFATDSIGGTIVNQPFAGTLATSDGRRLQGLPFALFPWRLRVWHWLTTEPWSVLGAFVAAIAGAFWLPPALRRGFDHLTRRRPEPAFAGHSQPPHLAFAVTTALCTGVFISVITGFTFRLYQAEAFGQFYDHQAASLLAGRLDVPETALSSESFRFAGKYYGYFGPTPALLRLPFALTGVGFGQLSRSYMVAYYVACLAAVYALLVHAARLLSRRATWPARSEVALLVGSAGLGSTLFFVSSRAYIYHEAILCGAAFALWSAWSVLRWLAAPAEHRWWILALAGGILAVHARPPAGLFALTFLGCAAAALIVRRWLALPRSGRRTAEAGEVDPGGPVASSRLRALRTPFIVGLLAVLGVLSFNGLSYLKFKSFEGAPLRHHVQYHADRLANIGGSNFHLTNIPYGFASYCWRPNFVLRPTFPYFYIQGHDPGEYPGSRIDLAENTLALPYAMPPLVFLASVAGWCAIGRWPASRLALGTLAAGTLPMAAALCSAIAISQRYTADFVPFLVTAAAFGLTGIAILPKTARRFLHATTAVLAVAAMLITLAITLHYQGEGVWGVPDETRGLYQSLRQQFDAFLHRSHP